MQSFLQQAVFAALSKMAGLTDETPLSDAMSAINNLIGSTPVSIVLLVAAFFTFVLFRTFYRLYWHPLAKFPGPWYCAISSLPIAIISVLRVEPQWLHGLVKKYGST